MSKKLQPENKNEEEIRIVNAKGGAFLGAAIGILPSWYKFIVADTNNGNKLTRHFMQLSFFKRHPVIKSTVVGLSTLAASTGIGSLAGAINEKMYYGKKKK